MKLKIICLNLYEGGLLLDSALDFFDSEQPDILLLQEVFDGKDSSLPQNYRTIEELKFHFPDWSYYFEPEFLLVRDEDKVEIGNAIFSRFPILNSWSSDFGIPYGEYPLVPADGDYSKDPKNIQCAEIEVEGQVITACNLHGIWGLDGGDNEARLKMSQIIIDQVKNKKNLILAGDFNVKPNTQTISNIENHLVNVFKDELETTFNLSRKNLDKFPGYVSAVVDMFFVSSDLQVENHYCPNVDASDHLPLVVEITI